MTETLYLISGIFLGISVCALYANAKLLRKDAVHKVTIEGISDVITEERKVFLQMRENAKLADKCIDELQQILESERRVYKALEKRTECADKYIELLEERVNEEAKAD